MIETWENLQARLFHLGWLGEELSDFVATPGGGWLFRQIIREAQTVVSIAADYVAECEKAALTTTADPSPATSAQVTGHVPAVDPREGSTFADTGAATDGGGAA
jgi:hypothetical protein